MSGEEAVDVDRENLGECDAIPSPKKTPSPGEPRTGVLDAITAPLGFFVLALLIVESFLGVVLTLAGLEKTDKIIGMWAGVGMFVLVVVVVAILVWFKPQNLTYDKRAHLQDRGKIPYGTETQPVQAEKRFEAGEKEEKGVPT